MANVQPRSRSSLRFGLQASALAAVAALGFLVAAQPRTAAADGFLPTITIPSVPGVTLPISLPITTTPSTTSTSGATTTSGTTTTSQGATTTAAAASPAGGASAAAPATAAGATTASAGSTSSEKTVAGGLLQTAGSAISIPVTSVAAPNRLVVVVTVAPHIVKTAKPVTASIRVRDAQGHLVRGATVAIRSVPTGVLRPVANKRSAADGRATFVLRTKNVSHKGNRLWLLVTATDPARPKTVLVSRTVGIPIAAKTG